ncbi:serine/threonine protein kinase [Mycolicibacillus parakoreensis]|uniref:Protein kinase n=2 Tax=Mycobacteriaceae TaxID=1762 RepID=A0ABY3U6Z8_9MYCO|nr:protein kinase [Mycolicibacillus parakoreensis]MCV7314129.1 serine/threonine protein kinase [Mycolicibacillus parakoreensis]ULN54517.1 protein kinase [Mycolicibacillus parakoreensis]HLR99233.1 protein kinase [Mycolicibacillus parakoreensis]
MVLDGRYRVDATIAAGGTSTVYRGLDLRLDRPVAVKVMDARYAGDRQFLTRFQMEARAIARLTDPALVAVYDQGLDAQHPFLVMELVSGGTLRELLAERGPMPPHAVVAVLRPLLGALGVAHRAGLVHRDIKPENVLISDDGDVKVADFGLVRAVSAAGITSTSVILGTAAYLSPEQVSHGDAGPASDVYGVGVLTYELLTGRTPFAGDSAMTVAYQRLDHDVPPPSAAIDGVPPQFDALVARATRRSASERYADAAQMAAAVAGIVEELELPDFRVPAPHNSAEHRSTTALSAPATTWRRPRRSTAADAAPTPHPTRQFTFDVAEWDEEDTAAQAPDHTGPEEDHFAGIAMSEFAWQRHRGRRRVLIALALVVAATGLAGAGGWALGSNLAGLL